MADTTLTVARALRHLGVLEATLHEARALAGNAPAALLSRTVDRFDSRLIASLPAALRDEFVALLPTPGPFDGIDLFRAHLAGTVAWLHGTLDQLPQPAGTATGDPDGLQQLLDAVLAAPADPACEIRLPEPVTAGYL